MRTRHRHKRTKIENESRVTLETRGYVNEDLVPTDLVFEILTRLPSKSIARFVFVSKVWARIIRSRDFIRTFASRALLRKPRLLYAFKNSIYNNEQEFWNFFSSSSTSTKGPPTYLSHTRCSIPHRLSNNKDVNEFPHYVNGLISVGSGREQIICNPSTRKSIPLPKVKSRRKAIQSFFGYDHVNDQYKVLCMSENLNYSLSPSSEHQVFTLGGVDKSWRMIECSILHRPKTNGVCINGVVYYGAWKTDNSRMPEWRLARFDVRSEKFDQLVPFLGDHSPPPLNYYHASLMSYKGKVTLAIDMTRQRFELWVLEDAEKHEWSKICFNIIKHPLIEPYSRVRIMDDTSHTGEIVFALREPSNRKDFCIFYYDHKKNSLRYGKIKKYPYRRFSDMIPFINYVESVMLL